jgi:hypothetical protein
MQKFMRQSGFKRAFAAQRGRGLKINPMAFRMSGDPTGFSSGIAESIQVRIYAQLSTDRERPPRALTEHPR